MIFDFRCAGCKERKKSGSTKRSTLLDQVMEIAVPCQNCERWIGEECIMGYYCVDCQRYCMNCGQDRFSNTQVCDSCNVDVDDSFEAMYCAFCGTDKQLSNNYCDSCGLIQLDTEETQIGS